MKSESLLISLVYTIFLCGCASAPPKEEKAPSEVHAPVVKDGKYIVVAGDTAAGIAMKFDIMLAHLIALNPNQDWTKLKIGQQVTVSK